MKAYQEIGMAKSLKFLVFTFLYLIYRAIPFPQFRSVYLRLLGAKIGSNCIIHDVRFFNYYRTGFGGLTIGNDCFLGDETLIDLAAPVVLEDQVTLAERVLILTHLNVGYADHPLQKVFPAQTKAVAIRGGSFIGAGAVLLHGVEVGPRSFVGACSLVREKVHADRAVAGVPAREIKTLQAPVP